MKTINTIICLLSLFVATAQWTTDTALNTLVADSDALDMQSLTTSDGQTYIVFWKAVAPPTNIELRMQVLDGAGNQTLGSDGMLISDQIPMSSFTVLFSMVVDEDNNLFVGVTGTGGGDPAFVFKLDTSGTLLWDPNNVEVGSGNVVTVLPLGSGDAIVSWLGSGGAVMQRYDSTGNSVWPTEQPITTGSGTAAPANIFEISGGDFIAVFHQLIGGINSNLYAQRYDGNGDPQWTNAVLISSGATAFNRSYTGLQDGDVVYMGYFASTGTRFDSYLQRINPDGTLPWGVNGSDFDTNQTDYEMTTAIAFESGSGTIWSVCDYTDPSQSMNGTYIQKFDKNTGARLLTDTAKVVFPIGSEKVSVSRMYLKDNAPLFLMREGVSNGVNPTTLHSVLLDGNGDFAWVEETREVATFAASKGRIQYNMPVSNQSVAVFVEDRGNGAKIYAQNFLDGDLSVADFSIATIYFVNPVQETMNIQSTEIMTNVSIHNILGQLVYQSNAINTNNITVNTSAWRSGVYLMSLQTNSGVQKGIRLIKE